MNIRKLLWLALLLVVPVTLLAVRGDEKSGSETLAMVTQVDAGGSLIRDSVWLFNMYQDGFNALSGRVILYASQNTKRGYGLVDTSWIWLYGYSNGERFKIDSSYSVGLPDTMWVEEAYNGVVFRGKLGLVYQVADSTGDTVGTYNHDVDWDFVRSGQ